MIGPSEGGHHRYLLSLFRRALRSKRNNPQAVTKVAARLSGQGLPSKIRSCALSKQVWRPFNNNNRRRQKLPRQQRLLLKLRRRKLPRRPREATNLLKGLPQVLLVATPTCSGSFHLLPRATRPRFSVRQTGRTTPSYVVRGEGLRLVRCGAALHCVSALHSKLALQGPRALSSPHKTRSASPLRSMPSTFS